MRNIALPREKKTTSHPISNPPSVRRSVFIWEKQDIKIG